jgi:hypothetical protein
LPTVFDSGAPRETKLPPATEEPGRLEEMTDA